MNPFSFKITPILCLEIAWENSTAAAKRAGKLAVYNQKVSLFSGTSLGLLLKKAWSHLCPYRCQKFVLIHSTKGKAREHSHWLPWWLLFDPGGCRVPEKILIPGHNQFTSHLPRSSDSLLVLSLWRKGTLPKPWQQDSSVELKWVGDSMIGTNDSLRFTYLFCRDQNFQCELPIQLFAVYPSVQLSLLTTSSWTYNPNLQFCICGLHL